MWPFQSIQSGRTVARWRSRGAPRSRSIMGYGGNFMRADRSEAGRSTASSPWPVVARTDMAQKKAVVLGVGAERGLGAAASRRFAKEGYHVLVAGRTAAKIEKVAEAIRSAGGSATPVILDGTREADVIALVGKALADNADGAPADLLVFNMGNNAAVDVREMTAHHFEDSWRARCLSPLPFR